MNDEKSRIVELDLNDILPNRFQPRIKFNEESIIELCDSIKEHGVIQPIIVRPIGDKYEIVAGERRYKACVLSGRQTIPSRILDLNDKDSAEVALIENVQREGLTPIEEAISYKKILDMGYITQEQLAQKLGRSQSTIANKKRLLNLCDEVQEALMDEKISERHARSLLKLSKAEDQQGMLKRIIAERLTVRKLDEEIDKLLNGDKNVLNVSTPKETKKVEKSSEPVNPGFVDVDKIKYSAKDIEIEDSIIDLSYLFDDDIVSSNMVDNVVEEKKNSDNLNTTNLYNNVKDDKSKEENGVHEEMFIDNTNNSNFDFNSRPSNQNNLNIFSTPSNDQRMSMDDIMRTENSRLNNSSSNSNSQGSMFNNLMNQGQGSNVDNYIDAETFKNYLDPAYIDGQRQIEPQNKDVIDSSVFAKFLDPEYDLSNNNNPIKDQLAKNEPTVSSMSFGDYLNSDKKAEEIPVSQTIFDQPKSNVNIDALLQPTISTSVPEIKVDELPIVVPSEIPKEEPVVEVVPEPVKEEEPPVMVMATDLSSLNVTTPELSTTELLTSSPLEVDQSILKNIPSVESTSTVSAMPNLPIPTIVPSIDNNNNVKEEIVTKEESEVSMQEDIQSIVPKDYDVGAGSKEEKPDLLAPIGSPVNYSSGPYDPNKTIEQVNREREESQRRLYEQATAPLTPDFSAREEKVEEKKVEPVPSTPTDKPIFVTATQTNVSSLTTSPIIDNPELSNLLKREEEKVEDPTPAPVVQPEPYVEQTPINPSIDTIENKPIIVTDYDKQYDPVLPVNNMPIRPTIELKEVINMIRKLDNQIEALGFSIDTEEYDLEDQYQVIFKIDKK